MGIIFGLTLLLLSGCGKGQGQQALSAPTVEVMEVIQKDVPVYSEWIGSTDGTVNATIRAQVQGYLIKQLYREGDLVRRGQILFEIDPRPFQAALDQAKAEWDQAKASMNRAKATLDQAKADVARMEAQYATARANLRRIKDLVEQELVSQKDLDDAVGAEQSAGASVSAAQAAASAQPRPRFLRSRPRSVGPRPHWREPGSTWVSRKSCRPSTASRASPKRRSATL